MDAPVTVRATLDPGRAASETWDVLVVGAGPAGAATALHLARHGRRVLLVEAKSFPRPKVCGGCLNGRALELLADCGLDEAGLRRCGAVPLTTLHLACGSRSLDAPLPTGAALSRGTLDAALVERAVAAGAEFLPATTATIASDEADDDPALRAVRLTPAGTAIGATATARIVVAADGLGQAGLREVPALHSRARPSSRVGLGALLDDASADFPPGRLTMAVGARGYVGLTRVEGNRLNVAAAVDSRLLADSATPADVVRRILDECGQPVPAGLRSSAWHGTPALTRFCARHATRRLFAIGDAAGYVEPFTGEGIAWALLAAAAVAPLVESGCAAWRDGLARDWERAFRRTVSAGRWPCRLLAGLLRSPGWSAWSLRFCRAFPVVPRMAIAHVVARSARARRAEVRLP